MSLGLMVDTVPGAIMVSPGGFLPSSGLGECGINACGRYANLSDFVMGAPGLSGMGRPTAETVHKVALTKQVEGLEAVKPAPLLSQVEDAIRGLEVVEPWSDSSWWSGYDSAVELRQRLERLRMMSVASMAVGVYENSPSAENRAAAEQAQALIGARDEGLDVSAIYARDAATRAAAFAAEAARAAGRTACEASGGTWDEATSSCSGAGSAFGVPTWLKVLGGLALGGYLLNSVARVGGR